MLRDQAAHIFLACQHARTPQDYADRLVRHVAAACDSEICAWWNWSDDPALVASTPGVSLTLRRLQDRHGPFVDNTGGLGLENLAAAPMLFRSRVAGVLAVANRCGGYLPEHLDLLQDVSRVALPQYELLCAVECMDLPAGGQAAHEGMAHIVHALRQPLSVIENSAFYLSLILPPQETKAHSQLSVVRTQVEHASRILDGAAQAFNSRPAAERDESLSRTSAVMAAGTY